MAICVVNSYINNYTDAMQNQNSRESKLYN